MIPPVVGSVCVHVHGAGSCRLGSCALRQRAQPSESDDDGRSCLLDWQAGKSQCGLENISNEKVA